MCWARLSYLLDHSSSISSSRRFYHEFLLLLGTPLHIRQRRKQHGITVLLLAILILVRILRTPGTIHSPNRFNAMDHLGLFIHIATNTHDGALIVATLIFQRSTIR